MMLLMIVEFPDNRVVRDLEEYAEAQGMTPEEFVVHCVRMVVRPGEVDPIVNKAGIRGGCDGCGN